MAVLPGHNSLVSKLKLLGSTLVSSDASGCICVWSLLDSPSLTHRLQAHPSSVTSFDFDGLRVVSAGTDGSIRLTSTENGELLGESSQNAEAVWQVAFTGENTMVAVTRREGKTAVEVSRADSREFSYNSDRVLDLEHC